MSLENMQIWNKLKKPPAEALKKIKGGRLSGMTDISPQWRYMALTEIFGPCGVGWKYEITKLWNEEGSEDQTLVFATVNFFHKTEDEWSEAIPGIGGSTLVAKEKSGLHSSDEAYKMAVTDALSVALKMIGVAADIYLNNLNGSKYQIKPKATETTSEEDRELSKAITSYIKGWTDSGTAEIKQGRNFADWWKENSTTIKKNCTDEGAKIVYDALNK